MHRIALYYPIQIGMWQRILQGIFQYARPAKPWVFTIQIDPDPSLVLAWKPDAIIGQIETPKAAEVFCHARALAHWELTDMSPSAFRQLHRRS